MLLHTAHLVQAIIVIFISGILYGFSDFIMKALNGLSSKNAIAAMQNINVTVYRSLFMVCFVLLIPTSIAITVWSIATLGWENSIYSVVGTLFYLLGMFMITGMGNVPLNESLKQVDNNHSDTNAIWRSYYRRWTRLNTVRSVCGMLAGVSWLLAIYLNM